MYFKYGSYQHDDNTVTLASVSRQAIFSPRGRRQIMRERLQISGVIIASTQATIKSAVDALEAAYADDGKDAGLYHDNDSVSSHFLDSSASLGGVRVVSGPSYPKGDGAEYATGRDFTVVLEADFPESGEELTSFQETLRIVGTGGPRFAIVEVLNGLPQSQIVQQRTSVVATQSGRSVGLTAYPFVPPPIFPVFEIQGRRDISTGSPTLNNTVHTNWPVSWVYHFHAPGPLSALPNRRQ
ncbi:hypothetical protein [uncultured Mediterranean phage uvDeep-CGR2-KM19-C37]|nr:hypothetical protein [uncultured Mediterranean phage uvDeep-CGR2-KM19-C37]